MPFVLALHRGGTVAVVVGAVQVQPRVLPRRVAAKAALHVVVVALPRGAVAEARKGR